jgi:hypothetical protein
LHEIGISPLKIQMALQLRDIDLAMVEIGSICRPGELVCFADSSAELINFMQRGDGRIYSLEEYIDGRGFFRVAIFTQTQEEIQNLEIFGDVIDIDSPHDPLKTD